MIESQFQPSPVPVSVDIPVPAPAPVEDNLQAFRILPMGNKPWGSSGACGNLGGEEKRDGAGSGQGQGRGCVG